MNFRYHNTDIGQEADPDTLTLSTYVSAIQSCSARLGVCVIDIFDFPCSIPSDLISQLEMQQLVVVVNKVDTLGIAMSNRSQMGRLRNIIKREVIARTGISPLTIHLVSAQTGVGVQRLFQVLSSLSPRWEAKPVYYSSLISQLG